MKTKWLNAYLTLAFFVWALNLAAIQSVEAATFTYTGSMGFARWQFGAALLTNGQVVVAGGFGTSAYLSSSEVYNPASQTWSPVGSLAAARVGFQATLLTNGQVLAAGGQNNVSGILSTAELYNPVTQTWTNTGSMTTARQDFTTTLLPGGEVLAAGGNGNSGTLSTAELYNPALGTWTNTGSMTASREVHTATLLPNGKVLVAGGVNGVGYLSSAELYDPALGTWTNTGSMSAARSAHTATLLPNGKVLVAGGDNGVSYLSSAELYDPALGTWTNTGSMSVAHGYQTATLLSDGEVLITGGLTNNGGNSSISELYNPASGTWSTTAPLNVIRDLGTATLLLGGQVLVAGGGSNDFAQASAELYTPDIGALRVNLSPPCAVEDGAQWQVDGGVWNGNGAVVTNLAGGNHIVSFTNLASWITPSNQTVLVANNATNNVTGVYVEPSLVGANTWINTGGGSDSNWSTAANWSLNRAPTSNDLVLIPNTGGSACRLDVDATVAGLVLGECAGAGSDGLLLNGHNLEVDGPLTIQGGASFPIGSGTLTGNSNTVIGGVINWTSGTLAGTLTLANTCVLNTSVNTTGKNFGSCLLTNYGTFNWSGDQLNGGTAVIDNYGLWNAEDDQGFGGSGSVFNNYGTFRKSGGTGTYPGTLFNSGMAYNQLAGVTDVKSGTNGLQLTLQGGGSFTGGYFTTNSNGTTALSIGNFTINGATTTSNVIDGAGLVGANVIRGALNWQNGPWNGSVTISSNCVLSTSVANAGKSFNNGCIVSNYGTFNWSTDGLFGNGGAVVDNYGLWNAQDNQNLFGTTFNNYGTFLKSGGNSGYPGSYFESGTTFNQSGGILSVQTGDVSLAGSYSLSNGTLNFGINSPTDNGVLLAGPVALGGALSANLNVNFAPALGDQFGVIGSTGFTGSFSTVSIPAGFSMIFTNNSVVLEVTGAVPVQLLQPHPVGTNFFFQFPTASGQSYTIQQNTNLATTNWVFYTNITGTGSVFQFQTPVTTTNAQLFFRVREP